MFREFINANSVLLGCERSLSLDYAERDIHSILDRTINNIGDNLGLNLSDKSIYDLLGETKVGADTLNIFLQQIGENLKAVAFHITLLLYDRKYSFTLRDYNYLGFSEEHLLTALKYLQDSELYSSRDTFFDTLIRSSDKLAMCELKRWLCIMAVFEKLGICEGVALIAMLLFICGERR